jgi:hypothetical protein
MSEKVWVKMAVNENTGKQREVSGIIDYPWGRTFADNDSKLHRKIWRYPLLNEMGMAMWGLAASNFELGNMKESKKWMRRIITEIPLHQIANITFNPKTGKNDLVNGYWNALISWELNPGHNSRDAKMGQLYREVLREMGKTSALPKTVQAAGGLQGISWAGLQQVLDTLRATAGVGKLPETAAELAREVLGEHNLGKFTHKSYRLNLDSASLPLERGEAERELSQISLSPSLPKRENGTAEISLSGDMREKCQELLAAAGINIGNVEVYDAAAIATSEGVGLADLVPQQDGTYILRLAKDANIGQALFHELREKLATERKGTTLYQIFDAYLLSLPEFQDRTRFPDAEAIRRYINDKAENKTGPHPSPRLRRASRCGNTGTIA